MVAAACRLGQYRLFNLYPMIIHTRADRFKPRRRSKKKREEELLLNEHAKSLRGPKKKPSEYVPKSNWRMEEDTTLKIKSLDTIDSFTLVVDKTRMHQNDAVMNAREEIAQRLLAAKKNRIAPAYNKGAYQYITDGTDPKELGKKSL